MSDKASSQDFADEKGVHSDVEVTSVGAEYSEYLDLEAKFEADHAARKRLLRKCGCSHLVFCNDVLLMRPTSKATGLYCRSSLCYTFCARSTRLMQGTPSSSVCVFWC